MTFGKVTERVAFDWLNAPWYPVIEPAEFFVTRFVLVSDVFVLSACAIRSGLSHQYWPMPASTCRFPTWPLGFTCPPNIQPSCAFETSLYVHSSAWTFT